MQPAHRVLSYLCADGASYIDLAQDLSKINRRLYSQGMSYAVRSVDFMFSADPGATIAVAARVSTAGDTWVVHNAWKKAFAHWTAQQRRARRLIGQSAKPTWEDFKVYLDDSHRTGTILQPYASDSGLVSSGEWDYSRLIWEADDASIDEVYLHLIGGDVSTTDWGLILGYQNSRATVQLEDPDLPAEYSINMYTRLAQDQDSVADEVAQNMEDENDDPPYDQDDYPGSDTNSDAPWITETASASVGSPNASLDGFVSQCGLLMLRNKATDPSGETTTSASLGVTIHLAPGGYKGVAAIPMGQ